MYINNQREFEAP